MFLKRHKRSLAFKSFRIKNFSSVEFRGVHFTDMGKGLSIMAQKLVVTIHFLRLFAPARGVFSISLVDGELMPIESKQAPSKMPGVDLNKKLQRIYRKMMSAIAASFRTPFSRIDLRNIKVNLGRNTGKSLHVVFLQASGLFDRRSDMPSFCGHSSLELSRVGNGDPIKIEADNLRWQLQVEQKAAGECVYKINLEGDEILLDIICRLDASGLYIDDSARLKYRSLQFTFSFQHFFGEEGRVNLEMDLSPCTMADMLRSFPGFCCTDIYSAAFSGNFDLHAALNLQIIPPFDCDFKTSAHNSLRLKEQGNLALDYLKYPFRYSIRNDGKKVRELFLDQSNPDFIPLKNIPGYLKSAIVLSEDGNFYTHKGIDDRNLGHAIFVNIGTRNFTRGGSTITMQLMKNLFLHRGRTIKRKIEEVILAWLTQEVFQVSKDRLLEIYLNIIQFSPEVYGIAEASRFYFSKRPEDLSLTESLVLSYILPRPRHFIDALKGRSLILSENLKRHIDNLSSRMLLDGYITIEQFGSIRYEIEFSNGLGRLCLNDKTIHLHTDLQTVFSKALKLWKERYGHLSQPFLSCTYNPEEAVTHTLSGRNPHNFDPSLAFDVAFRNPFGLMDRSETLFHQFAELISEADAACEIIWGGNFKPVDEKRHFELKDWQNNVSIS